MIAINLFLIIYLFFYVLTSLADLAVDKMIPDPLKGVIGKEELKKSHQYTLDKTTFSLIRAAILKTVFLFIILSGILPWLAIKLSDINYISAGLLFFGIPGLLTAMTELPFDYYHSFVIEERYGFNTQTFKIWVSGYFGPPCPALYVP